MKLFFRLFVLLISFSVFCADSAEFMPKISYAVAVSEALQAMPASIDINSNEIFIILDFPDAALGEKLAFSACSTNLSNELLFNIDNNIFTSKRREEFLINKKIVLIKAFLKTIKEGNQVFNLYFEITKNQRSHMIIHTINFNPHQNTFLASNIFSGPLRLNPMDFVIATPFINNLISPCNTTYDNSKIRIIVEAKKCKSDRERSEAILGYLGKSRHIKVEFPHARNAIVKISLARMQDHGKGQNALALKLSKNSPSLTMLELTGNDGTCSFVLHKFREKANSFHTNQKYLLEIVLIDPAKGVLYGEFSHEINVMNHNYETRKGSAHKALQQEILEEEHIKFNRTHGNQEYY